MNRARPRKRLAVWVVGVLALTVAVVLAVGMTSRSANAPEAQATTGETAAEPSATPVSVAAARRGPVAVHLATTSAVEAERTAKVLSRTSGVLTGVLVREGDTVAAGQVLARVDPRERELALEQAELRLARAEAELTRQTRAFEAELVSEYDYDKAQFDRDLAASERETARLELEHTTIRAPFAGTVTELLLVAGAHLDPAQHLLTLADFSTLIARVHVPERDVAGLAPGQVRGRAPRVQRGNRALRTHPGDQPGGGRGDRDGEGHGVASRPRTRRTRRRRRPAGVVRPGDHRDRTAR